MIVVLKKEKFGEMKVGLLRAVAFFHGTVFLGCRIYEMQHSRYCYYVSTRRCQDLEIVKVEDLADRHPLQRTGTLENFYIALHHYVSDSQDPLRDSHDDAVQPDVTVVAQLEAQGVERGMGARYGNAIFILFRSFYLIISGNYW